MQRTSFHLHLIGNLLEGCESFHLIGLWTYIFSSQLLELLESWRISTYPMCCQLHFDFRITSCQRKDFWPHTLSWTEIHLRDRMWSDCTEVSALNAFVLQSHAKIYTYFWDMENVAHSFTCESEIINKLFLISVSIKWSESKMVHLFPLHLFT